MSTGERALIPIAILINGFRVFLTGFLVFFVDPKMGEGFMHITEGWMIFAVIFCNLLGFTAKSKYSFSDELSEAAQQLYGMDDRLQVMGVLAGSGAAR